MAWRGRRQVLRRLSGRISLRAARLRSGRKTRTEAFSGQDLQQLCSSSPPLDATCQGYPRSAVSGVRDRKQDRRPYLCSFQLWESDLEPSRCWRSAGRGTTRGRAWYCVCAEDTVRVFQLQYQPATWAGADTARVDAEIRLL